MTLIFLALQINSNRSSFNVRAEEMHQNYVEQQKELTKSEMEAVLRTIDYKRSLLEEETQLTARNRTREALRTAWNIYNQNWQASPAAVREMILQALSPLNIEENGAYYFIYRQNDGISLLNGEKIKDDDSLTYSEPFEPFDWIIGTGLSLNNREARLKKELLKQIGANRYGKHNNGYFFVGTWEGINLAHGSQPELVGTDLWETEDSRGTKTSQALIALAKQPEGGFTEFWWPKPDTGEERPKIVYARGIPDWEWLIGTGVYLDDIDEGIKELENQLNKELYEDLRNTVFLTLIVMVSIILSFRLITNWILKDLSQFSSYFDKAAHEDKEIGPSELRFEELYQMAASANHLLREKIEAQKSMQDEKDRYKALHEATFGGVMLHEKGIILDCNESLTQITGYSPEELIGMNGLNLLIPKSREIVLHYIENHHEEGYETIGLRKDGTKYPLVLRTKEINYKGRDIRVTEVRDITKRKKAEEDLRNILQSLPIAVVLTNEENKVAFRNNSFTELFGYSEEEVSSIDQWWNRAYPDDKVRERGLLIWGEALKEARAEGSYFGPFDTTITCRDGSLKNAENYGIPLGDSLLSLFVDVTDRKRLEEERLTLDKLKTLGTLAGGLAHDFNNILTGLYGNVSLAKSELDPNHPSYPFIDAAEESMDTATRLTNQLLTFAKGGAPIKQSLSLGDLISKVVNFNLSGSNVKLQMTLPENLWLAHVDQGQMQQVFGNLTINALHAMPQGGHISLTLENQKLSGGQIPELDGGNYIKISLSDEGSGISPEHLERIFDPYFTTKETGSGLGLATTYSIVRRHGGHISVKSRLGKGTTFILYLPALSKDKPDSRAPSPLPQASHFGEAKILVMDDEAIIRKTLEKMLNQFSYTVETCAEGKKAMELYKHAYEKGEKFDLVILDLTIPGGIGGKETARHILNFDKEAKIVISSGYADEQLMADHEKNGLAGVIAKPYTMTILQETLARFLEA